MNADTPRDRRNRGTSLLRTTDYARRLLRSTQLVLAVLAVPVSMTVGVVVAGAEPTHVVTSVSGSASAGSSGIEQMSLAGSPPAAPRPGPGSADDDERAMLGTAASLVTLIICWLILGAVGLVWRHRLDLRDLRDWADGWARVEPLWSDRPL